MDSVVNQTLKDIEIICIDDGSRDSTGNILDEYAQKDNRIKVIHKANSGYGHSMNVGLQNATGEYIGIIETDDFADLNMFDELYKAAKENHADVVKSNYYSYVSQPEPQSTYYEVLKEYDLYDQVFRPVEHPEIFRVRPCIWSGIYRREWLLENHVSLRKHRVLPIRIQGLRLKYGQVRKEHCWFVMPTFIIAQIMQIHR